MINVTRTTMPPFEEFCEEIRGLWDSRILTNMGPKAEALSRELERFLDVPYVSLFANGHLAMEGILRASGLPQGGEVITTPLSFASTVNAIIRCGLVPVFADVLESDGTMNPDIADALVTDRTVAILPVHVYGNVCDAEAFASISSRHGLKLIYDGAHAFGVRYNGRQALLLGDASIVSFHATKVFSTAEGGAVCFADESLALKLADEKNFGIRDYEDCVQAGGNAKMNEFQAAMGLCNLRHFSEAIAARKKVYDLYMELLRGHVSLLEPRTGTEANYSYLPVLTENRDAVYRRLLDNGIHARKYFYPLLSDLPYCSGFRGAGDVPHARYIADRVLCLPLYPGLAPDDVRRICELL